MEIPRIGEMTISRDQSTYYILQNNQGKLFLKKGDDDSPPEEIIQKDILEAIRGKIKSGSTKNHHIMGTNDFPTLRFFLYGKK